MSESDRLTMRLRSELLRAVSSVEPDLRWVDIAGKSQDRKRRRRVVRTAAVVALVAAASLGGLQVNGRDDQARDPAVIVLDSAYAANNEGKEVGSFSGKAEQPPRIIEAKFAASVPGTVRTLIQAGGVLIAAGMEENAGTVWRSTDQGITWMPVTSYPNMAFTSLALHDGVVVAAGNSSAPEEATLVRSEDQGATWEEVTLPGDGLVDAVIAHDGFVALGSAADQPQGASVVWPSADGGVSWQQQPLAGLDELDLGGGEGQRRLGDGLQSIAWDSVTGTFVALGGLYPSGGEGEQPSPEDAGTLVALSEDGTNWKTVVASESLWSVSALRQGGFLANGQKDPGDSLKSYMFTSGDGQSWTAGAAVQGLAGPSITPLSPRSALVFGEAIESDDSGGLRPNGTQIWRIELAL